MKVLLDTCVWGGAVSALKETGHDVFWCGDLLPDPGDNEILALAADQKRILITLDKDFGELAVLHNHPHSGIIRLVNIAARKQGSVAQAIIAKHGEELLKGAVITAYPDRNRIRPPD